MHGPTVYVMGAGSSVRAGAPVLKNFFLHVLTVHAADERVRRVARFLRTFFRCDVDAPSADLPTYETVLTFLDLALQNGGALDARYHEREILQLRDDMLYLLWLVLRPTASGEPDPVHREFAERVLKPGDALVSLNYDLLADHALYETFGVLDYGIPFARTHQGPARPPTGASVAPLLKIHGSLNWLFCPTCNTMACYLGGEATGRIFLPPGEHCPDDGSYLKGVLIPPTWVKSYRNPFLQQVWLAAEARLRSAGRVVFIGYSLASSDVQVIFALCRALHNNPGKPRVEVVNPERRDTVHRRYRRAFGEVVYHAVTFEEWLAAQS